MRSPSSALTAASPAQAGAQKVSFQRLATTQLPRLYALAGRLVGDDAEDAEDAVQDCLLKAYRGFRQLKDDVAAPAWLTSILVNRCRDRARARAAPDRGRARRARRVLALPQDRRRGSVPYSDSLHLDFLQEFGGEDVRAVLATLPEHYRFPLVLTYMEEFATKEVARMLDLPLGTVLARLHRGRKLFEKCLWEYAESNGLLRPKFSLVRSVSACKTWCFAVFGWGLLGYASLSPRSSNARFWSSVGVVSCW
jgi:RNA polymerase sigma-70 factor (ECF subfamily)